MALFCSVMLIRLPRCLRSCPILRHTWYKVAFGQRRPHHLRRGRPPQPLRGGVHPATERVPHPVRHGEQVLAVYSDRRTSGEPELLSLLIGVDRHQLDFGLGVLLSKHPSQGLLRRLVGRTPVEVQHLYPHKSLSSSKPNMDRHTISRMCPGLSIHPSAWKGSSANFGFKAFSEVALVGRCPTAFHQEQE